MFSKLLGLFCRPVTRGQTVPHLEIYHEAEELTEVVVDAEPREKVFLKRERSGVEFKPEKETEQIQNQSKYMENEEIFESPRCVVETLRQVPVKIVRKTFNKQNIIETSLPRYQQTKVEKKRVKSVSKIPIAIDKKESFITIPLPTFETKSKYLKEEENLKKKTGEFPAYETDTNKKLAKLLTDQFSSANGCYGGGWTCHRCKKTVYHAERLIACGNAYHKTCFSCASCKKLLGSMSYLEAEMEIFCKSCYLKNFSHCGYGYPANPGQTLSLY